MRPIDTNIRGARLYHLIVLLYIPILPIQPQGGLLGIYTASESKSYVLDNIVFSTTALIL